MISPQNSTAQKLNNVRFIRVLGHTRAPDDNLCRVFKDVAKSEIAEEEEGNVLYFVERPADGSESKVLSLCKLKTLEYRLFRKMREKLRNHYARKVSD